MAPLLIAISLHKLRERLSCMPFKPKPIITFLFPAAALLPLSFSFNFLCSDLPSRALAFFSHMLIPPYLFLLVNCIIITIAVTSAPQGEEWERVDVAGGRRWAESGDGSGGGVGRRQREGRGGVDEACRRKSSSGMEEEEEEEGTSVEERARNEGVDYDDEEQEDEWKDIKSLPRPPPPPPLPSMKLLPSSRCHQEEEEEEDPWCSKQQRAGGDGIDDDEEDEGWMDMKPFPLPPPPPPPISPSSGHSSVEGNNMSEGRGMPALPPPLSLRCKHINRRAMKDETTNLPAPPPPPPPLELLPCWRPSHHKTAMWASPPPNPGPSALLKSKSFHAHHAHCSPDPHREGMGMSVDELNMKVEAFIAKFNLRMRLQNHA